jgi:hypothetical protein
MARVPVAAAPVVSVVVASPVSATVSTVTPDPRTAAQPRTPDRFPDPRSATDPAMEDKQG